MTVLVVVWLHGNPEITCKAIWDLCDQAGLQIFGKTSVLPKTSAPVVGSDVPRLAVV